MKKITKQNKNIEVLLDVIEKLANKEELDITYNNHKLINYGSDYDYFECYLGAEKAIAFNIPIS